MPLRRRIVALALALALAGCGAQESIDDAKAQVSIFHNDLGTGDFDLIWKETSPQFRQTTSKADFDKLLAAVHDKLGAVKASKQVGWQVKSELGVGKLTVVVMDTEFEHGVGQETFTYIRKDDRLELMGYNINSQDMMVN